MFLNLILFSNLDNLFWLFRSSNNKEGFLVESFILRLSFYASITFNAFASCTGICSRSVFSPYTKCHKVKSVYKKPGYYERRVTPNSYSGPIIGFPTKQAGLQPN